VSVIAFLKSFFKAKKNKIDKESTDLPKDEWVRRFIKKAKEYYWFTDEDLMESAENLYEDSHLRKNFYVNRPEACAELHVPKW